MKAKTYNNMCEELKLLLKNTDKKNQSKLVNTYLMNNNFGKYLSHFMDTFKYYLK